MKKTALIALILAVLLLATTLLFGACKPKPTEQGADNGQQQNEPSGENAGEEDISLGENEAEWPDEWNDK